MKFDRRNFLQGAAVTSGAALLGSVVNAPGEATRVRSSGPAASSSWWVYRSTSAFEQATTLRQLPTVLVQRRV
jgi:hypothetical protein